MMRYRRLLLMLALLGCGPRTSRELRVCADPNNLPFSNQRREGLENSLAELIAKDLGARVSYTWWPQRRGFIRNTLAAGKCDVIMGPTSPTAAFKIGEKANDPLSMYLADIYTISCNLAGLPGVSIPCGFTKSGLPIGVQIIGRRFDDHGVLSMAKAWETARGPITNWPKPPG